MQTKLSTKIPSIIPPIIFIETKHMYRDFRKKGYKILRKIDIRKNDDSKADKTQLLKVLKIFKILKHVNSLKKLFLLDQPLAQSKILYMAKRMSNARILIDYTQIKKDDFKSLSGLWIKYMKRIRSHGHHFDGADIFSERKLNLSKYKNFFLQTLRFQPGLKTLKIQTSDVPAAVSENFWKLDKYPATLERLSLLKLDSKQPMTSSLKHLKHLEIISNIRTNHKTVLSIIPLLPPIASHLRSLSLSWPGTQIPGLKSASSAIKTLNHLTCLKLGLHCTEKNHFETLFEAFSQHSLIHLALKSHVNSEAQLVSIAEFIKRHPDLKFLQLKVTCHKIFESLYNTTKILQEVDNLPSLKRLSVSIVSKTPENQPYPELYPIFSQVYTKSVPLESFKIKLKPLSISNQNFLVLIDSVKPLTSTLKKLKIHVGKYTPDKSEFKTVFDFIKTLKNIQSLQLNSLSLPLRQFFNDLAEIILEEMPYLRTLILGEVKGTITKPALCEIVKKLLQKRGIEEFDCSVSDNFRYSLAKSLKGCPKLSFETIKNFNPYLLKYPSLFIFDENDAGHFHW